VVILGVRLPGRRPEPIVLQGYSVLDRQWRTIGGRLADHFDLDPT